MPQNLRIKLRKEADPEMVKYSKKFAAEQNIRYESMIIFGYASPEGGWIEVYVDQLLQMRPEFEKLSNKYGEVLAYCQIEEAAILHEVVHLEGWEH